MLVFYPLNEQRYGELMEKIKRMEASRQDG